MEHYSLIDKEQIIEISSDFIIGESGTGFVEEPCHLFGIYKVTNNEFNRIKANDVVLGIFPFYNQDSDIMCFQVNLGEESINTFYLFKASENKQRFLDSYRRGVVFYFVDQNDNIASKLFFNGETNSIYESEVYKI